MESHYRYGSSGWLSCFDLALFSVRRQWRRQRSGLIVYQAYFFFFSFYLSLFFIPGVISAATYPIAELFLPTHVSWLRIVNARLEFRKSYLLISQGAKNRSAKKMQFFTLFSLGYLTFSLTAQTRFELGAIWKQSYHLRWITFHKL